MAVTRQKKEATLAQLNEMYAKSKSIIFVKNNGLTVFELSKIKKQLRASQADAKVAKKTLMRLALAQSGFSTVEDSVMDGPIVSIVSYDDEVAGAKVVKGFMKEIKAMEFTGGIFNGVVYNGAQVLQIAALPGKQELLGQVVGRLKSPIVSLHYALVYNLRGVVTVLSKIQEQKAASVPAPAKAEAPTPQPEAAEPAVVEAAPVEEAAPESVPATPEAAAEVPTETIAPESETAPTEAEAPTA